MNFGKKYFNNGDTVAGQWFEYTYDDIGNLTNKKRGGNKDGTGLNSSDFTANSLNQYTSVDIPNSINIVGQAQATASVKVSKNSGTEYTAERQGTYFHYNLTLSDNSSAPKVDDIAVRLDLPPASGTSVSGKVYLPKSGSLGTNPYDANGQLTRDGLWDYTWDGAGRLVAMEHRDTEITDPTERMRIEFRYDFMGRRIEKAVYPGASGGGYSSTADSITRFIYDGWLLMGELDGKNSNALIRSYNWSRDISGTRSGAAGIGGLALIHDAASGESYYPMYDPQHNLIGLVEADSGEVAARYEYGPFGEIIRVSGGSIAKEQPFGFSTKYTDRESGLVYFGYRYYQPLYARWLSRDPLGVNGGMNVYGFVGNNPLIFVDPLGLFQIFGFYFGEEVTWVDSMGDFHTGPPLSDPDAYNELNETDWISANGDLEYGIPPSNRYFEIDEDEEDPTSMLEDYYVDSRFANIAGFCKSAAAVGDGIANLTPGYNLFEAATGVDGTYNNKLEWSERLRAGGDSLLLLAGVGGAIGKLDEMVDGGRAVGKLDCVAPGTTLPSTGGVIRQFEQQSAQTYYRVFSGDSTAGKWLTAVPPRSSAFAQEALALPPWNKATMIQEVRVPAGTMLERSRAIPVPEWGRLRGGAEQFQLLDEIPIDSFGPGVPLR